MTKDVIEILSPKAQIYNITEYNDFYIDKDGGRTAKFSFVDQDGYRGVIRLCIEKNGNSQMYVEYANIMWVYNLIRIGDTDW